MSDDIKELVNGLRERAEHAATEGNMTATCDARYFTRAADALEALAGEVERLKGVLGEEERACEKAIITATKAEYAAAEAKAERDRLKAALLAIRQYVRGGPDHVSDDDITAVFRISNDALTEALDAKDE